MKDGSFILLDDKSPEILSRGVMGSSMCASVHVTFGSNFIFLSVVWIHFSELEAFHGWAETLWCSFGVRTEYLLAMIGPLCTAEFSCFVCFFFCYSFWESCRFYRLKFMCGWSYFGLKWRDSVLCCRTHDNCLPGIIPAGFNSMPGMSETAGSTDSWPGIVPDRIPIVCCRTRPKWVAASETKPLLACHFFLEKRNIIDFKKVHQDDTVTWNFPGFCQTAHCLKRYETQKDKLILRLDHHPCARAKKILWPSVPKKKRCRYRNILWSMPLKDSPCTEPVCSREDNLQKRRLLIIKNHCVSAEPNRSTQGCHTHKD